LKGNPFVLPYRKNLKEPSRILRKQMTDAEQVLWSRLRRKQVLGIQFYRQKPVGPYILDFYAPAVKLVVEADGSQHLEKAHGENDAVRDAFLRAHGLLVLRFDNRQILSEIDAVMGKIFRTCEERLASSFERLAPPFDKGGPGGISAEAMERQIPPNPPFSKGGTKEISLNSLQARCSGPFPNGDFK
jgi:very-short-patch-repair endonuclease